MWVCEDVCGYVKMCVGGGGSERVGGVSERVVVPVGAC